MWGFSVILFAVISLVGSSVLLCRKLWGRIPFVMVLLLLPTLVWYLYSPVHRGPPSIMKSIDRASIQQDVVRNWADTVKCNPNTVAKPRDIATLRDLVTTATAVRVVGGGHSWSPLICSDDTVISFEHWCGTPQWHEDDTVTFDAGCPIQTAQQHLLLRQRQLHGYGAIQHQTLAGGFMTALHGSQFENFAANVVELEAMLANGTRVTVRQHLDEWRGSMGLLGILLTMRLQTFPSKSVLVTERSVTLEEAMDSLFDNSLEAMDIKTIWGATDDVYHLRTFSEVRNESITLTHDMKMEAFIHDNLLMPALLLGSRLIRHVPVAKLYYPTLYKHRESIMDAWYTYPEFGFKNAAYSIPIELCADTLRNIRQVAQPYLVTMEVRKLLHAPGLLTWVTQPSCIVDLSFVDAQLDNFDSNMRQFHRQVELIVESVNGAAHWGKFYASNYSKLNIPGLAQFRNRRREYDPTGKFLNPLTSEIMMGWPMDQRYTDSAIELRANTWRGLVVIVLAAIVLLTVWPHRPSRNAGYRRLSELSTGTNT